MRHSLTRLGSWRGHGRAGIGQRLALSYGAIIVLLVALSGAAVLKLGALSETTRQALQQEYPKTVLISEVNSQLGIAARAMRNALIFNEDAQLAQAQAEIAAAQQRMQVALATLGERVSDPLGRELLRRMQVVHSAYSINQEDFIGLLNQHRLGEARNLLIVDLHGYQTDYFALLEQFNQHQGAQMLAASRQVEQAYLDARRLIVALAGLALLLSVLVTVAITRSLLHRLGGEPEYAADIARRIAAGDLHSVIRLRPADHGSLLYAMDQMRARLIERDDALRHANAELQHSVDVLHQMQGELVSSEKLAALGALVAGVAHELNTPIGNGLLAASTIQDVTRDMEAKLAHPLTRQALHAYVGEVHAAADIVLRNLGRAGDLITSFKQVAVDRESSQRRRFLLHEVVSEICLTLQPSLRKTPFLLQAELPQDLEMYSFPGPLGQVLTNLINNAVLHAFEGRDAGLIRIGARGLESGCVELWVSDDGCGIPAEHLSHVFEPFFTTKLGHGGSGLGLHIAFNIVTGVLGGKIRIVSQPGEGTTLRMTLPRHAPGADVADAVPIAARP